MLCRMFKNTSGLCRKYSILAKKLLADQTTEYKLTLYKKINETHNVRIFTFKLPEEDMVLGHACGQHVMLHAKIGDEIISRSYTPTSICATRGFAEFIIKIYFKNTDPKFPTGGKLTQHLESLKIGDVIKVSNPSGKVIYRGNGKFYIIHKTGPVDIRIKKLGFVVGGVGITPAIQILRTISKNPDDRVNCILIYASKTKADIVRNEELNNMVQKMDRRLKIWHTLEEFGPDWQFGKGFVTKEMLKDHLFPPGPETLILIAGPWPMLQIMTKQLNDLGYSKDMYSRFF